MLRKHPGLAQTVINFRAKVPVMPPEIFEDPVACANLTVLFNALYGDYDLASVDPLLIEAMSGLVAAACAALEASAAGQFAGVASLAMKIVETIERLGMKQRRVLLLELPVGNSLIVKLVGELLRARGLRVDLTRASIPRSDAARARVRLRTVLSDAVSRLPPEQDDLLVYVDEWETGSNFKKVAKLLDVIVQRRSPPGYLLAAALLSPHAKHAVMWKSVSTFHDRLAHRLGLRGEDLRFELPELRPGGHSEPPFFWSDRDRLCGYRKMQLWGAIFSTLDAMIEELANDPRLLDVARIAMLSNAAEQGGEIPVQFASDQRGFAAAYAGWQADYQLVRPKLVALDHPTHTGAVGELEAAIRDLTAEQLAVVEGRPARLCIAAASAFIGATHQINPSDRYLFEDHAAALVPLEGPFARTHEHVMRALLRRC